MRIMIRIVHLAGNFVIHANKELAEKENKKTIPLQLQQKVKYLRIHLTKGVKYLCTENSKTLLEETE